MKTNNYLLILLTLCTLFVSSCSKGDDGNGNPTSSSSNMGEGNKKDPCVTGGVQQIGMTYVNLLGYLNKEADIIAAKTLGSFGVEYGLSENALTQHERSTSIIDGKFTTSIKGLKPNNKYYYRCYYEINGIYEYGKEIGTFTTKPAAFSGTINTGDPIIIDYNYVIVSLGTCDVSSLANETIQYGFAYSNYQSKLTSGLTERYKKADFLADWDTDGTYDDVTFLRANSYDNNGTCSINDLTGGTVIYYTSFIIIGDETFRGEVKSVTSKGASDFNINDCQLLNTGFDFAEVGGSNLLTKDGKAVSVEELGSYTFGIVYSTNRDKLNQKQKLYELFQAANVPASYIKSTTTYDDVTFVVIPYSADNSEFVLDDLPLGTEFYYRVFLCVGGNWNHGFINTATTRDINPKTGYVDLGLSCNWAACNAGATTPAEKGTLNPYVPAGGRCPTTEEVNELNRNCNFETVTLRDGTVKGIIARRGYDADAPQVYFPNVRYEISRDENYTSQTGTMKNYYCKRFKWNISQFKVSDICYLWTYAGMSGGSDDSAYIRAVQ